METRKFKAVALAIVIYSTPVLMMFVLVLTKNAVKEDLVSMTKWMGLALSPVFLGYIGGVALEDYGKNQQRSVTQAIATTMSPEHVEQAAATARTRNEPEVDTLK